MTLIAGIGFAYPWLLLGLLALPILWLLLRAVPPAPRRQPSAFRGPMLPRHAACRTRRAWWSSRR